MTNKYALTKQNRPIHSLMSWLLLGVWLAYSSAMLWKLDGMSAGAGRCLLHSGNNKLAGFRDSIGATQRDADGN